MRRSIRSVFSAVPEFRPETGWPKLRNSYCHALSQCPIEGTTLDLALRSTYEVKQEKPATIFHAENVTYSYKELYEYTGKFADAMLGLGLVPGDRVAMWAQNIKEYPIVQFGLARAGLVIVTLNPMYTAAECDYACEKSEAKVLISPKVLDMSYVERLRNMKSPPKFKILIDSELQGKNLDRVEDAIDFWSLVESGNENSSRLAEVTSDTDDLCMIQFTSGTTGKPKAAGLTHNNIVNNARFCANRAGLEEHSRLQVNVPLFHCFSNVLGSTAAMVTGTPMIFPSHVWNAKKAIESIGTHKSSIMYGTPTMYIDMLREIDAGIENADFTSLEYAVCGASIMPTEIILRCRDELDTKVLNWFGTTENSPLVTACYLNDPLEKTKTTIGRPAAHSECKIVDDNGKTVPVGVTGELCSRGYQVFLGYLGDEQKTREAIDANRWYHTGDTAKMDDEGYVTIIGRNKDMINRGGENVYPSEIENYLLKHPNVADAQVVGAPDSRLGEVVAVYIKLRKEEENSISELKEFCKKELATFKIPKHWKVVDEYPTTLSGKVQKFELRNRTETDFKLRI